MLELTTPLDAAQWLRDRVTGTLQADSRKVQPGDGFIAWPGAATDAREHVASALARGAKACLVEQVGANAYAFNDDRVATFEQLKAASGPIATAFFGQPSQHLRVLAVTGTNGKTSTAWWLAQALSGLKQHKPISCGMVGTLGIGHPPALSAAEGSEGAVAALDACVATGLTTPDPVLLQQTFKRFVDEGVQACAIEVSSIGIEEHRLDGTRLHVAIFTNFTQDHLDYHGTMDAYWQAKARLFKWAGLQAVVINVDDVQGAALAAALASQVPDLWTTSCTQHARLQARDISQSVQGMRFTVREQGEPGEAHVLQTRLIGAYNVANLLGVIATLRALGVPLSAAVATCADLTPVPGRMEFVGGPGQPLAAVDYAHTPDALGKALEALRPLAAERGGQLWCVFGCGGNRDAAKRPLMGAMAARHADHVVVTSDNPRGEKPQAIISQILLGVSGHAQVVVEADRALAIAHALSAAAPHDVLLIAGKGHEDYQEVAGQRLPFSDLAQLHQALGRWNESHASGAHSGTSHG